jgi:hypothetical protein
MPYCILMILLTGAPHQVAEVVVCSVAVKMSTFHPFWAWPDECFQDLMVDEPAVLSPEGDLLVPVLVGLERP